MIELLRFTKQFDKRLDDFFAKNPLFASKVIIIDNSEQCIDTIKTFRANKINRVRLLPSTYLYN